MDPNIATSYRREAVSSRATDAVPTTPDPDAVDFIRYCYRRRRVGWPELYDEMCAVAARGLFKGMSTDDLGAIGIGFSLFDMPSLAALSSRIVVEEQALRKPVAVMITVEEDATVASAPEHATDRPIETDHVDPVEPITRSGIPGRFVAVPAGA